MCTPFHRDLEFVYFGDRDNCILPNDHAMGERKRGVSPDGWDIPTMHCNTVFGAMMTRLRAEPWPTALVDGLGRS